MEEAKRHLRFGVVDCGTNTFTLHIADAVDGNWETTFRQRRFVRLGLDSFRSGRLSPQRMRRGLDVLDAFGDTVRNFNVDQVRAFGCSALRDASNGADFVAAAAEKGWHIEVVAALAVPFPRSVCGAACVRPDSHWLDTNLARCAALSHCWHAACVCSRDHPARNCRWDDLSAWGKFW